MPATAWNRFRQNRLALLGALIVAAEFVLAAAGPALSPYDPLAMQSGLRLQGPSLEHWMGTDDLGRDILSRIVSGAQLTLLEGVSVVAVSLVIGVPLGACAAYFRRAEMAVMRITDIMLALPQILLALCMIQVLGVGLTSVIIGAGVAGIAPTVLLTRSLVLGVRQNEYVVAARAVGCGDARIVGVHILPNCASGLIVSATFRVGLGILTASSLSFLGLGAQPPAPEWGAMLSNGRDFLYSAPHVAAFPGLALAVTVLGSNLLGDGLRDLLDPRRHER
jgi:peptide/nickel transport system permease protein